MNSNPTAGNNRSVERILKEIQTTLLRIETHLNKSDPKDKDDRELLTEMKQVLRGNE